MPHKWVGNDPLTRVGDEDVAPGDTFEPTDSELNSFGAKIEAVEADDNPQGSDGEDSDETYTCVGSDGECSREVDEPGGRCWQHETE